MAVVKAKFWCLIIILSILLCSVQMVRLIDDAKSTTYTSPAKKYHKKLKKEDGAIRLVGGVTDNEGELPISFRIQKKFIQKFNSLRRQC